MSEIHITDHDKDLLFALRMVSYETKPEVTLTNENLAKAMTLNENLMSLGYTLKPEDLISLAKSPSLSDFYEKMNALTPDITAKPMYPDFPTEVMNMEEAQFRLHQMAHYFSTYGMEALFGVEVEKGWLPDQNGTPKTETDSTLLNAVVLELVPEEQKYEVPMSRILNKRERMTNTEADIVKGSVSHVSPEFLSTLNIPFKENMKDLFLHIAETSNREEGTARLSALCQHPGDVLRFTESFLDQNKFHLRTSQKRMFVDTLEKYPVGSMIDNLSVSQKQQKRLVAVLNHLDYNKYSKSEGHKDAVHQLKAGNLNSWEKQARYMLEKHDPNALEFVSKRPGMMLRMTSWISRLGYSEADIQEHLCKNAGSLSTQSLATAICTSGKFESGAISTRSDIYNTKELRAYQDGKLDAVIRHSSGEQQEKLMHIRERLEQQVQIKEEKAEKRGEAIQKSAPGVIRVLKSALREKMSMLDTEIQGKKVFVDTRGFDLDKTNADPGNKSMNGGYIPSTAAYKIPESANTIRAFVYWNDKQRSDVDLHATAVTADGESVHIGWDGGFNESGICFSGDITHSDAAEYIDIDLNNKDLKYAAISLNAYNRDQFSDMDTVFCGIMAVESLNADVKLYDPKNCFFSNDISNIDYDAYEYGFIDVPSRTLYFVGQEIDRNDDSRLYQPYMPPIERDITFSLSEYLGMLGEAQNVEYVEDPEEADVVLTMGKASNEKELSLIDNNFFYDAPLKTEDPELAIEKENKQNEPEIAGETAAAEYRGGELPVSEADADAEDVSADSADEEESESRSFAQPEWDYDISL